MLKVVKRVIFYNEELVIVHYRKARLKGAISLKRELKKVKKKLDDRVQQEYIVFIEKKKLK